MCVFFFCAMSLLLISDIDLGTCIYIECQGICSLGCQRPDGIL